jgi:hypothetical protein
MTKDEAQRSRWTFYEVVKLIFEPNQETILIQQQFSFGQKALCLHSKVEWSNDLQV